MPTLTPDETLREIEAGELAPLYLVLGDDDQEKAEVADAFERVIDEGLRAFNVDRFDGSEVTLGRILEAAQTLPMIAPRRLVIVQRLERCLMAKRESPTATAEQEAFDAYLESPYPHATLVLVAKGLDLSLIHI